MISWIANLGQSIAEGILSFIIQILPDSNGLPEEIGDGFETIVAYIYQFDAVIPLISFLVVVKWAITLELGIIGFKLIRLLLNFTRGSGA